MMALIGIMILVHFAVIFRAFPIPSVAEFLSLSDLMCFWRNQQFDDWGNFNLSCLFDSKNLTAKFNLGEDGTTVGLIAIMSFLIFTPLGSYTVDEANITTIPLTWIGTSGMFSAIIIGLLVGRGYVFIKEQWTIKMPAVSTHGIAFIRSTDPNYFIGYTFRFCRVLV